ncbi:hypothetical protein BDZ89DRAFT_1064689 [Hymenopellis radicata]|nr:hypothetical protein BDZ89DRAFT_1064689 [Hymenopellis radicata]
MAWPDGDWLTGRLMALPYGRPNYPRIWRTKCDSARGSVRLSMLRSFFESSSGPCYVHCNTMAPAKLYTPLKPLSSLAQPTRDLADRRSPNAAGPHLRPPVHSRVYL